MNRFRVILWYGLGLFPVYKSEFIAEAHSAEELEIHLYYYKGDRAGAMPSHLQDEDVPSHLELKVIEVYPEVLPTPKFALRPAKWPLVG